jgi:hypothetical protein
VDCALAASFTLTSVGVSCGLNGWIVDVGLCVVDGNDEDLEELGNAVLREMWLMLMMELAVGIELTFGIELTG